MSTADFETERGFQLARLELLQGIQPEESPTRRRELYNAFGSETDAWVEKARVAYSVMSNASGFVASVGNELSAELDIREHAELYAAVGGFDVTAITHGLGSWWSPSATWYRYGQALAADADLSEIGAPEFETIARLLLDAGAQSLARFFAIVADGGLRLVTTRRWLPSRRRQQHELAFVVEVALARSLLFRDGPDEGGRYFQGKSVTQAEIVEAVTGRRSPERAERRPVG